MVTSDEQARRIAGEMHIAKQAASQREAALKAWASVRGDVPINSTPGRERAYGFVERKRTSRPSRDQLERALMFNRKLDLDELYKTNVSTRFEQHTPREPDTTADDAALMSALERSVEQQQQDICD